MYISLTANRHAKNHSRSKEDPLSLFISFEGGEGTGKTTQVQKLCQRLRQSSVRVVSLHEPGTTSLGKNLRKWLKREQPSEEPVSKEAELLLFAAARAELVNKIIKPNLESQRPVVIVADRYMDSTTAYQGYGRQIPLYYVRLINEFATQNIKPDVTFLLDCSPENSLERVVSPQIELPFESVDDDLTDRRIDFENTRRFEEESRDFHERVRKGYQKIAEKEQERIHVIDATLDPEEIGETIWEIVGEKLAVHSEEEMAYPLWHSSNF